MLNPGFGFQSWNAKRGRAPSPDAMGQALAQRAALPSLGMGGGMSEAGDGTAAHEMAPGDAAEDMAEGEMEPGYDEMSMDGQSAYDPAAEHSATNTRAALEDAVRRSLAADQKQALKRPPAPGQAWQLATLGLDPTTIQLLTETGDAAGGL